MSDWSINSKGFKAYLRLEKSLSANSIDAYMRDVDKLAHYCTDIRNVTSPTRVDLDLLKDFITWVNEIGMSARTQSRIISGIKAFYKYLLLEDAITGDPTELLETPKIGRKLPDTLSTDEIDQLIGAIDLSKPEGHRNKAILETLFGCGLRVSELVNMKLSDCYFEDGFVRIVGKGDKERLVPVSSFTVKLINQYVKGQRAHMDIQTGHEDFVFLNRRGKQLTRVMIFTIIKRLTEVIGLKKNISPHTFRHSFATSLVEAGADLRAVQEMLGHESITTTEIYTHLDRNYLRQNIIDHHPRSKKKN